MVGFLMVSSISQIDFRNLPEAIPAYMCIIAMPFAYSISEGISFGIISYAVVNTLTGHTSRVSPLMYILAVIFVLKYVLI
jgi:AGZA family xanthine/uracil permease-like MFS transporter